VQGVVHGASYVVIGLLTALPALLTVALMPLWGASSDRRNERAWHLRIAMLLAAIGWIVVIAVDLPAVRYLGLIFVAMGSFCALLTFWTFPASATILSPNARPAGIALINCIGIGGGSAIGPLVIGYLKDLTGSFTSGARLCRGNADRGRDLHHPRGRADPRRDVDTKPEDRMMALTPDARLPLP